MDNQVVETKSGRRHDTNAIDRFVDQVRRDARRRNEALPHMFAQIEISLKQILSTPLLQNDAHCQNLVAHIARAGTAVDFADRVSDLQRHVRRLAAQKGDHQSLGQSQSRDARFPPSVGGAQISRHRIQI
ncbi:hypothetical protein IWQ51_004153 [Labrenzia sp. EL_142]|nr:hypothetical protein [Labrenzia sp. EL_142]